MRSARRSGFVPVVSASAFRRLGPDFFTPLTLCDSVVVPVLKDSYSFGHLKRSDA